MSSVKTLEVLYHGALVGTLAEAGRAKIAFSYSSAWLKNGFSISPFSLPLSAEVFVPGKDTFQGLFGVFADSLPDAWGRLLVDRELKKHGIDISAIGVLDRLALVGDSGRGALTYHPVLLEKNPEVAFSNLDEIAEESKKLIENKRSDRLDELYFGGASSGGARPKVYVRESGKEWMVKFPAATDPAEIGFIEKTYCDCAYVCGIRVPETKLFPSKKCKGYFGGVRFDRIYKNEDEKRVHMLTAAALLEADFTTPCFDYRDLLKLTKILTRDNRVDVRDMYRLMCFNVFAHNRDDHAKNFTFLYDEDKDSWHLSPAYDLTYSNTYFGEQTTSVDGEGRNPGMENLLSVGKKAGLPPKFCRETAEEIHEEAARCMESVRKYIT